LAKNFGGQNSFSFVNGVLGTVYKTMQAIKPEGEAIPNPPSTEQIVN